jgi:hypothetical protein
MYWNGRLSTLALGAHNHRYALHLQALAGQPLNVEIEPATTGTQLASFEYRNGADMQYTGRCNCRIVSLLTFAHGLDLTPDEVHTIFVPKNQLAAWLVEEGPTVSDTVNLYSNELEPVCTFEQAASGQQVRLFVRQWFDDYCDQQTENFRKQVQGA